MKYKFRFLQGWIFCLVIFLALRLSASWIGYITASGPEPEPLSYTAADSLFHEDRLSHLFVNVWQRWDTAWYLKIAAFGYDPSDGTASFSPLYPWLIRGLGSLTGNFLLSALLISNLAALVGFILFYEVSLVEGLTSNQAVAAVLSLALFPSTFFFFAAYTDSLFFALALGAWLSARRRSWWVAGALGGLAALARLQGGILMPVLGLLWLRDAAGFRWRERATWRNSLNSLRDISWLATFLPGLAFLGWNFYLRAAGLGSVTETLAAHWGIRTVPPWDGIGLFINRLANTPRVFVDYVDLAALTFILTLLILGWRRIDPLLSLYAWLNVSLFFMRGTPPHLLDSFSRYMLAVFPAFIITGHINHRAARAALWIISFLLQIFLLMGFLDWRWVA